MSERARYGELMFQRKILIAQVQALDVKIAEMEAILVKEYNMGIKPKVVEDGDTSMHGEGNPNGDQGESSEDRGDSSST